MHSNETMKKNLIMFPLGTVGRDMVYTLVTNYLLTFILFTKQLTNGQLGAITAIMVGARIFDALNDPIMGDIIEHTRTKWGKFKPWLVIGILTTSVVVWTVFNVNLTGWKFVVLFGFFYFFYSLTYTMHDISYWGMIPALSSDADARNRFTAKATLFAGIGSTLAGIAIPMLTTGQYALGGNAKTAYGIIAGIVCVLASLFLSFTIFGVRERRDNLTDDENSFSLKAIFNTIKANDQLSWIAVIFLIQQIGNGLIIGGLGSTYIYIEFGYNGGLYSLFTTIGMAATAFLMIFYPAISKRIHRKPLMKIMLYISIAGYVLMLGSGLLLPAGDMAKYACIVLGYMISNFGQYCYYLIMMISIINAVEYNEYKTGRRDEAIITSLRPFITKLSSALTAVLTSGAYMIFGITRFTNRISEYESSAAAGTISETEKMDLISQVLTNVQRSQASGLLILMTVLPCLMMIISYLLYIRHYILDEDEYVRICNILEERQWEESYEHN